MPYSVHAQNLHPCLLQFQMWAALQVLVKIYIYVFIPVASKTPNRKLHYAYYMQF